MAETMDSSDFDNTRTTNSSGDSTSNVQTEGDNANKSCEEKQKVTMDCDDIEPTGSSSSVDAVNKSVSDDQASNIDDDVVEIEDGASGNADNEDGPRLSSERSLDKTNATDDENDPNALDDLDAKHDAEEDHNNDDVDLIVSDSAADITNHSSVQHDAEEDQNNDDVDLIVSDSAADITNHSSDEDNPEKNPTDHSYFGNKNSKPNTKADTRKYNLRPDKKKTYEVLSVSSDEEDSDGLELEHVYEDGDKTMYIDIGMGQNKASNKQVQNKLNSNYYPFLNIVPTGIYNSSTSGLVAVQQQKPGTKYVSLLNSNMSLKVGDIITTKPVKGKVTPEPPKKGVKRLGTIGEPIKVNFGSLNTANSSGNAVQALLKPVFVGTQVKGQIIAPTQVKGQVISPTQVKGQMSSTKAAQAKAKRKVNLTPEQLNLAKAQINMQNMQDGKINLQITLPLTTKPPPLKAKTYAASTGTPGKIILMARPPPPLKARPPPMKASEYPVKAKPQHVRGKAKITRTVKGSINKPGMIPILVGPMLSKIPGNTTNNKHTIHKIAETLPDITKVGQNSCGTDTTTGPPKEGQQSSLETELGSLAGPSGREVKQATLLKVETIKRKVEEFLVKHGETRPMEQIDSYQLDIFLSHFFLTMKKATGEDYEPNCLLQYFSMVKKYLEIKGVINEYQFPTTSGIIRDRRHFLMSAGLGNKPNAVEKLTDAEEEQLWASRILGGHNPQSLLNTMWFYVTKTFQLTDPESGNLKWEDVSLVTLDSGEECLMLAKDSEINAGAQNGSTGGQNENTDGQNSNNVDQNSAEDAQNETENANSSRKEVAKIMANHENSQRCIVALYKLYRAKRPNQFPDQSFYLTPIRKLKKNDLRWYRYAGMGINKLHTMLQVMCQAAGIKGRKTNRSLRDNCGEADGRGEFPPRPRKRIAEEERSRGTMLKLDRNVRKFDTWLKSYGEQRPMEMLNPQRVDQLLSLFFVQLKRDDGRECEPTSLVTHLSLMRAYFEMKGFTEQQVRFPTAKNVVYNKIRALRQQGLGNKPNASDPFTKEEEELLWEKGQFGFDSTRPLLNAIMFYTSRKFNIRYVSEAQQLKWSNFELTTTSSGLECLVYTRTFLSGNDRHLNENDPFNGETDADDRPGTIKTVYASRENPGRCLIALYKTYAAHRPNRNPDSDYYLMPINNAETFVWYREKGMGINSFKNLIPKMCNNAGIGGKRTYLSINMKGSRRPKKPVVPAIGLTPIQSMVKDTANTMVTENLTSNLDNMITRELHTLSQDKKSVVIHMETNEENTSSSQNTNITPSSSQTVAALPSPDLTAGNNSAYTLQSRDGDLSTINADDMTSVTQQISASCLQSGALNLLKQSGLHQITALDNPERTSHTVTSASNLPSTSYNTEQQNAIQSIEILNPLFGSPSRSSAKKRKFDTPLELKNKHFTSHLKTQIDALGQTPSSEAVSQESSARNFGSSQNSTTQSQSSSTKISSDNLNSSQYSTTHGFNTLQYSTPEDSPYNLSTIPYSTAETSHFSTPHVSTIPDYDVASASDQILSSIVHMGGGESQNQPNAQVAAQPDVVTRTETTKHVSQSKTSQYKINFILNKLHSWMTSTGEMRHIEDVNPSDVDNVLCSFFTILRKEDGTEYEAESLRTFCGQLRKYLQTYHCREFKLLNTGRYINSKKPTTSTNLNKKFQKLENLSEEEEEELWSKGMLGGHNSKSLLNTLWYYITKIFGIRSSPEHKQLKWGDLHLSQNAQREEFLFCSVKPMSSGISGVPTTFGAGSENIRIFANHDDPSRCIVSLFKQYRDCRPSLDHDSPFYLRPTTSFRDDSWYKDVRLEYNRIMSMLPNMCHMAGIKRRVLNHCVPKAQGSFRPKKTKSSVPKPAKPKPVKPKAVKPKQSKPKKAKPKSPKKSASTKGKSIPSQEYTPDTHTHSQGGHSQGGHSQGGHSQGGHSQDGQLLGHPVGFVSTKGKSMMKPQYVPPIAHSQHGQGGQSIAYGWNEWNHWGYNMN